MENTSKKSLQTLISIDVSSVKPGMFEDKHEAPIEDRFGNLALKGPKDIYEANQLHWLPKK